MSESAERWQRCPGVLWRHTLDSIVLLAPTADEPITVSGSGRAVWDRLATPVMLVPER